MVEAPSSTHHDSNRANAHNNDTTNTTNTSSSTPPPWSSKLKTAIQCSICLDSFSETHIPTALPCQHIFGSKCIKNWLTNGSGDNYSCPVCRYIVRDDSPPRIEPIPRDAHGVWRAVCAQPPHRINEFMMEIYPGLKMLWKMNPAGTFGDLGVLTRGIMPALESMRQRHSERENWIFNPAMICEQLIGETFDRGLAPVNGIAVTFVRLARLMSTASSTLPAWLSSHVRMNRLIWRANACMDIGEEAVHWDMIVEASRLEKDRYFPLLYLYTVLISQTIAHNNSNDAKWPSKRHEVTNLVVERCVGRIPGDSWLGSPSSEFKDVLVRVYEKLRVYQLEQGKISFRGHDCEENIVRGIWALAWWEG